MCQIGMSRAVCLQPCHKGIAWLAVGSRDSLSLFFMVLKNSCTLLHLAFYVGARDLNSGPHDCTSSIFYDWVTCPGPHFEFWSVSIQVCAIWVKGFCLFFIIRVDTFSPTRVFYFPAHSDCFRDENVAKDGSRRVHSHFMDLSGRIKSIALMVVKMMLDKFPKCWTEWSDTPSFLFLGNQKN